MKRGWHRKRPPINVSSPPQLPICPRAAKSDALLTLRVRALPGTSHRTHLLRALQEGASSGHVEDLGSAGGGAWSQLGSRGWAPQPPGAALLATFFTARYLIFSLRWSPFPPK